MRAPPLHWPEESSGSAGGRPGPWQQALWCMQRLSPMLACYAPANTPGRPAAMHPPSLSMLWTTGEVVALR